MLLKSLLIFFLQEIDLQGIVKRF